MKGSQHTQKQSSVSGKRSVAVPNKEAVIFGTVAAWIVLIVTLIVTQAWRAFALLGYAVLYCAITFIVCTGVALLLNKIVAKQEHKDEINESVLD